MRGDTKYTSLRHIHALRGQQCSALSGRSWTKQGQYYMPGRAKISSRAQTGAGSTSDQSYGGSGSPGGTGRGGRRRGGAAAAPVTVVRTLSATAALVASSQAMGRMTKLSSARSAPPSSPGRPPSSAPLPCQT